MWTHVKEARTAMANRFLRPKRLLDVIAANPSLVIDLEAERSNCIALSEVIQWDRFVNQIVDGMRGLALHNGQAFLSGQAYQNGEYRFVPMALPAVSGPLKWTSIKEGWHCDISQVHGLLASKSDLTRFESLGQFVSTQAPEMIADMTAAGLRANLAHGEIRILDKRSTEDFFVRHTWDGRVFLANSGGSHHFAAARMVAGQLGVHVPLSGRLYTRYLDERVISSLMDQFDIFAVRTTALHASGMRQGIEGFRAAYAFSDMPAPFNQQAPNDRHVTILWLPKSNERSTTVAKELRQAGFFDMNAHFMDLLHRQSAQLRQWQQESCDQKDDQCSQQLQQEQTLHARPMRPRM